MNKFQEIKAKLEEISLLVDSLDKQKDNSGEWSEKDSLILDSIIGVVEEWEVNQSEKEKEYYGKSPKSDWLKTLKDKCSAQPTQKRSEAEREWSKEDKMRINEIIETLNIVQENRLRTQRTHYSKAAIDNDIEWLKNLKGKVVPQPSQEWSEEDEENLHNIIWLCNNCEKGVENTWIPSQASEIKRLIKDILRDGKPQSHWKPSEEQMEALANALSLAKNCGEEHAFDLRTLYEQLKKLREE